MGKELMQFYCFVCNRISAIVGLIMRTVTLGSKLSDAGNLWFGFRNDCSKVICATKDFFCSCVHSEIFGFLCVSMNFV